MTVVMRADVFFVRRAGVVIAEPTGGTEVWIPCPDPHRWWAEIAPGLHIEPAEHRRLVEVEAMTAYPDHGNVGRVVRVLDRPADSNAGPRRLPSDLDAVSNCLDRVPESWLPYEGRESERPGPRWDAFVGTLLPVPRQELHDVLGEGWDELIRVEPWLTPR
jgi:hypothetical protein